MKEILEALKTKFEGVSESNLRVIAKNLHAKGKGVEDVESVTFQQVIDAYGDHRATEAAKTAREKAEAEFKATQTQPGEGGTVEPKEPTEDIPAWAKAVIETQKATAEAIARIQGEKVIASRSEKIKSIISQLPEELQEPYSLAPVSDMDDQAFEAYIEKIKPQVEAISVKLSSQAAAGVPASAGGAVNATVSDAMKTRLERKEKEAANQVPAVTGLEKKQ